MVLGNIIRQLFKNHFQLNIFYAFPEAILLEC